MPPTANAPSNPTTETDWEPPEDFNAMEALLRALVAKAEGEPYNEDELLYATMLTAAATLTAKGLDIDTAIACVESAMQHGDIHLSYSEAEGLSLTIGEDEAAFEASPSR